MGRNELSSIMLTPDTSRIESYMERLGRKLCTCIICEFMSLRGYHIDCAVHLDCRYQCDIPTYRPRAGDMPSRIRDSPTSLSRPRPSSERRALTKKLKQRGQDTKWQAIGHVSGQTLSRRARYPIHDPRRYLHEKAG